MERETRRSRGEAALERLLERIDAAIDEYQETRSSGRRSAARRDVDDLLPGEDAAITRYDEDWDAWWALPFAIRDWLLWYVPGWWALSPARFRHFLLTTARLIVWNRLPPRRALYRAATRLRLPPPRPRPRPARISGRSARLPSRGERRTRRRAPTIPQPSRRVSPRRTASIQALDRSRRFRAATRQAPRVRPGWRGSPGRRFGGSVRTRIR